MKLKRIIKFIVIGLVTVIVLVSLGLIIWSKTSTYPARSVAQTALQSTDLVTVTQNKFIVFTPHQKTQTGLIFYPGGLVEPTAYAPVLQKIAENGILVVIVPVPLNLAILNPNAGNPVFDTFPEIHTWILAGHSLGGATAAIFAENHPAKIDAIAFWDSYPPGSADLSDNGIPTLSIFGTTDGFPNTDNFNDQKHLLPENTIYFGIEGASHAQFGDYGPQKGDITPAISLEDQHEQVVKIMLDFIAQQQ